MITSIHQEIIYQVSADNIYQTLISSRRFAEFTDAPAQIEEVEGGAFSCFGGQIVGRNIELIDGQRIVQVWKVKAWDPGNYSIVRISLEEQEAGTRLTLNHSGFPQAGADHLEGGWHKMYWNPLKAYLEESNSLKSPGCIAAKN